MSDNTFEVRPSGLIEFDAIAPEAVAKQASAPALDASIETDPFSVNFERHKDTKPTAAERMLAGPAIDWLVAFPMELRPKALCERFPHVANRLAKEWLIPSRAMHSLQALANDSRWGGAGFPAQVQLELRQLLRLASGAPGAR